MIRMYPLIDVQNEVCLGVTQANKLDYEVAPFPVSQTWISRVLYECRFPHVSSSQTMQDSIPIFPIGKFYPCISCRLLECLFDKAPDDWRILVLTANKNDDEKKENITDINGIQWKSFSSEDEIAALVFRDGKTAIPLNEVSGDKVHGLAACLAQLSCVYSCDGVFSVYRKQKEKCKDRKLLAVLSSHKRIKDACRQIYTFMDQSYGKYKLQVMLRGVSEYDWIRKLQPSFQHFIDEGRLIVNIRPNDTQLNNLSKFGDGVDRDSYDLICKIDDDDWYDRDYLKRVNAAHRNVPLNVCSMIQWIGGEFRQKDGYPFFSLNYTSIWGGSMLVLSKTVQNLIRRYIDENNNPKILEPVFGSKDATADWSWREDHCVHRIAKKMGYIDRYHLDHGSQQLIVSRCGTSMTRSEVSREWYINWKYRFVFHLSLRDKIYFMRIDGIRISEVGNPNNLTGEILVFGDSEFVIRWDTNEIIRIKRQENGLWKPYEENASK